MSKKKQGSDSDVDSVPCDQDTWTDGHQSPQLHDTPSESSEADSTESDTAEEEEEEEEEDGWESGKPRLFIGLL